LSRIVPASIFSQSLVICSDVIEHLVNPTELLRFLYDTAAVTLLSTPERDLSRGTDHWGPPQNEAHVREWNLAELHALLEDFGFYTNFIGLTRSDTELDEMRTIVAVLTREPMHGLLEKGCHGDAIVLEGAEVRFIQPPVAGPSATRAIPRENVLKTNKGLVERLFQWIGVHRRS
jgi:hypothetical protein